MTQFLNLTIPKIHEKLLKREFSAIELTKSYLERIKKKNKDIFAFITISEDLALLQAKKADELIAKSKKVPILAGIPMGIKDNILIKDVKCTAGSKILENYIAPYDAAVIEKLKSHGAVFLGKTNLDEFAMGGSCERSAFGPTKNPYDLSRVPGGSSGGSAAAVSSDMCVCALGSDTGGSIRQPASFCGVIGMKPTYGTVSRYGLIAFASSLDQIGPITKTSEDAKIVLEAIAGKDNKDSTSIVINKKLQVKNYNLQNLRIGVPKEYFEGGIDTEVERIIKKAIGRFEELGAKVKEISLPHTKYALPVYYIISPSEASANLARFDGVRYGMSKVKSQKSKVKSLLDAYLQIRGEGFGEEVRRRIMLGTYALSAGYYDAYYLRAQKVRTLIKQDFDKAFQKVDVILTPTSPTPAFKIGEKITDPLTMYLADIFTIAVNLAGVPSLSLPVGRAGDLPVGIQIIGKPLDDYEILDIAQAFEQKYENS